MMRTNILVAPGDLLVYFEFGIYENRLQNVFEINILRKNILRIPEKINRKVFMK